VARWHDSGTFAAPISKGCGNGFTAGVAAGLIEATDLVVRPGLGAGTVTGFAQGAELLSSSGKSAGCRISAISRLPCRGSPGRSLPAAATICIRWAMPR